MYVHLAQCIYGQQSTDWAFNDSLLMCVWGGGHGNHVTFTLLRSRPPFTAFVTSTGWKFSLRFCVRFGQSKGCL